MKKLSKWLSAAAAALIAGVMTAVTAFAADDFCIFEGEGKSNGSWGQAVNYNTHEHESDPFQVTDLNENSKVYVTFEVDGTPSANTYGLEFILQRWETEEIQKIWAKVNPIDVTDGVATFDYASIVAAYGSDDFSDVDQLFVGDTGLPLTVTNVSVDLSGDGLTDFGDDEEETEETTAAEEEKPADDDKAETTAEQSADKADDKADDESSEEAEEGGVNIILIVVIAVAVIGVVVVIIVLKTRKRYY